MENRDIHSMPCEVFPFSGVPDTHTESSPIAYHAPSLEMSTLELSREWSTRFSGLTPTARRSPVSVENFLLSHLSDRVGSMIYSLSEFEPDHPDFDRIDRLENLSHRLNGLSSTQRLENEDHAYLMSIAADGSRWSWIARLLIMAHAHDSADAALIAGQEVLKRFGHSNGQLQREDIITSAYFAYDPRRPYHHKQLFLSSIANRSHVLRSALLRQTTEMLSEMASDETTPHIERALWTAYLGYLHAEHGEMDSARRLLVNALQHDYHDAEEYLGDVLAYMGKYYDAARVYWSAFWHTQDTSALRAFADLSQRHWLYPSAQLWARDMAARPRVQIISEGTSSSIRSLVTEV